MSTDAPTTISPATLVYRRRPCGFEALRAHLAAAGFRGVSPPDAMAAWECIGPCGTRVRATVDGVVLVEAADGSLAGHFDRSHRAALPSDRAEPDGGDPPLEVRVFGGSDEAGKGESGRPLVVAAVAVPVSCEDEALARGVRDGKHCTDASLSTLAAWIESSLAHEVRTVPPAARTAALSAHGGNETRLLAALHAEVLQALHARVPHPVARVDRFAPGRPVAQRLSGTIPGLVVDEAPRAERHIACAAASILARRLATA